MASKIHKKGARIDALIDNMDKLEPKASSSNDGFMSAADKEKLDDLPNAEQLVGALGGKQDVIDDLATIRSGAAAGGTAYQKPGTGIPESDMSDAVKAKLAKAESALQEHQDISGKQDVIQDLSAIRSGAAAGGTAYQKPGTGIPSSDLSAEVQDMIENGGKTKSVSVNGGTPVTPDANGLVDLTIEQANVTIGTVTTGAAGSNADVHNSGTPMAPVLDFVIPQGQTGQTGPQGPMGESVIVGQGDLPLTHVLGQSTEKAMSQKGVTDAIDGVRLEVVNNLTEGGATKVLSAEMGKELKRRIDRTRSISEFFILTEEDGFFIVDEGMNIGLKFTSDGLITKGLISYEILN